MQAIREYAVIKNGQIVLNLPEYLEQLEVEVIILDIIRNKDHILHFSSSDSAPAQESGPRAG